MRSGDETKCQNTSSSDTSEIIVVCYHEQPLLICFLFTQGDGEDLTDRIRQLRLEALCFLNIPSHGAGTNPWGTPPTREQVCLPHCMEGVSNTCTCTLWIEKELKKKTLGDFHSIFDQNMVLYCFFSLE